MTETMTDWEAVYREYELNDLCSVVFLNVMRLNSLI